MENTNNHEIEKNNEKMNHAHDLAKIHEIAKQYDNSEIMKKLSKTIESFGKELIEIY